ncbi:hypothetical protein [Bradyrhizobium sp. S69]|uniref:hypothetical protein n=1 Tax=Bradyrhizobium sp. S69 TaxID=1641856 RepID=UPI00131AB396|nr:hypothetical protein [Bradyrhizobium sp. S69]
MSERSIVRMAPGALALVVRGIVLASSLQASDADQPDDPERASKASCQGRFPRLASLPEFGFLKSRVYAKLLGSLILKRYQAFNGYPAELDTGAYEIGGLSDRQTAQSVCIRQGVDDKQSGNASGRGARIGNLTWKS